MPVSQQGRGNTGCSHFRRWNGVSGWFHVAEHCKPASDGLGHPAITPLRNLQVWYRRKEKLCRHLQYTGFMQLLLSEQERVCWALVSLFWVNWPLCQRVAPEKPKLPVGLKSPFLLPAAEKSSFTTSICIHPISHNKTMTPAKRSNHVD